MSTNIRKMVAVVLCAFGLLTVVSAANPRIADAAWDNEAFESEAPSGRYDGTFSLTYLGRGWQAWRCDWNDYVFRINVNRSYPGSDWKMYSNVNLYRRVPSGRPVYGFKLGGTDAHLCIGSSEFDRNKYPYTYWTVENVQRYVYTWRR